MIQPTLRVGPCCTPLTAFTCTCRRWQRLSSRRRKPVHRPLPSSYFCNILRMYVDGGTPCWDCCGQRLQWQRGGRVCPERRAQLLPLGVFAADSVHQQQHQGCHSFLLQLDCRPPQSFSLLRCRPAKCSKIHLPHQSVQRLRRLHLRCSLTPTLRLRPAPHPPSAKKGGCPVPDAAVRPPGKIPGLAPSSFAAQLRGPDACINSREASAYFNRKDVQCELARASDYCVVTRRSCHPCESAGFLLVSLQVSQPRQPACAAFALDLPLVR